MQMFCNFHIWVEHFGLTLLIMHSAKCKPLLTTNGLVQSLCHGINQVNDDLVPSFLIVRCLLSSSPIFWVYFVMMISMNNDSGTSFEEFV